MSPLKLAIFFPSDGKNEKTVIWPLGPLNTSQVMPASLTPFVRGTGLPSAPHALEGGQYIAAGGVCNHVIRTNLAIGPALKLPSQTISSNSSGPSGVLLVKASYATLVTKFCPV